MKILANENCPLLTIATLRAAGHDVVWARTEMPGATDEQVLARARTESPIIVTFDKDFGGLAYRLGLPAGSGIVLVRLMPPDPETAARRLLEVLNSRADWSGTFTVVEEHRIRVRPLRHHREV